MPFRHGAFLPPDAVEGHVSGRESARRSADALAARATGTPALSNTTAPHPDFRYLVKAALAAPQIHLDKANTPDSVRLGAYQAALREGRTYYVTKDASGKYEAHPDLQSFGRRPEVYTRFNADGNIVSVNLPKNSEKMVGDKYRVSLATQILNADDISKTGTVATAGSKSPELARAEQVFAQVITGKTVFAKSGSAWTIVGPADKLAAKYVEVTKADGSVKLVEVAKVQVTNEKRGVRYSIATFVDAPTLPAPNATSPTPRRVHSDAFGTGTQYGDGATVYRGAKGGDAQIWDD